MASNGLDDLLVQLEIDARRRALNLEWSNRLPRGFTERHYPMTAREQYELARLKTAAAMAVDADSFVALARGEAMPSHRITPNYFQTVTRQHHEPTPRKRKRR